MNRVLSSLTFILLVTSILLSMPAVSETYSAKHEEVKMLFQSNEEKTAKDAIWTADNIFKVGVIDDGTRRDGYAQYVCSVLNDYGFQGNNVWVQVIDIIKLTKNSKWIKLGESHCK
jgi:hypothetical protein